METHFDIDRIVKIRFVGKEKDKRWIKMPFISGKSRFFGLIKIAPIPAGWKDDDSYHSDKRYNDDQLKAWGLLVEGENVYRKPYVEVSLTKDGVYKTFETDAEAKNWINELITSSNKQFETIL